MKQTLLILSLLALASCKSAIKKTEITEAPTKAPILGPVKAAPKVEKKVSSGNMYMCQVNEDKRLVEFKKENGRCEIHYTKYGTSEQVAWAEATPTICPEVFDRIRTNIEGKGFTCQSISKDLAAK